MADGHRYVVVTDKKDFKYRFKCGDEVSLAKTKLESDLVSIIVNEGADIKQLKTGNLLFSDKISGFYKEKFKITLNTRLLEFSNEFHLHVKTEFKSDHPFSGLVKKIKDYLFSFPGRI